MIILDFGLRWSMELQSGEGKHMKIVLPEKVKWILKRLEEHGFEGYAVGGCVRDACLGREPNDWDITTSALPAQ